MTLQNEKTKVNFRRQRIFHVRHFNHLKKEIIDECYTLSEVIDVVDILRRRHILFDLFIVSNGIEYCLL